jgi:hypothetical protein
MENIMDIRQTVYRLLGHIDLISSALCHHLMVMADNLSYHLKNNDSSVLDTEDKDHSLKTIP